MADGDVAAGLTTVWAGAQVMNLHSESRASDLASREQAALGWLYSFSDWERGVGWNRDAAPAEAWKLGRTRALLDLAGSPDGDLRIVHVAGTKGKGSTSAYLESIARSAGWRVGAYTQPHLHRFRERIRLDGRLIEAADFVRHVDRLRALVEALDRKHPDAGAPTTFELTTVLALLAFAEAGVDLAIVEVGLGGRLDATNALATDLAILTTIGLDHRQILGRTLRAIAAEKAGIIRPGQTVISARQRPAARATIEARCRALGARLRIVGPLRGRLPTAATAGLGSGRHQRQNAALAVAAAEALATAVLPLPPGAIQRGLAGAWLPARQELARRHPPVMIDAAHNADSARALADTLRSWSARPLWLVLGILRDKDAPAILRVLLPLADGVVVATPTSPRALPAEQLAAACAAVSDRLAAPVPIVEASSVAAGVREALDRAGERGGVVVAGSFATAAEARVALGLGDVLTAEDQRARRS